MAGRRRRRTNRSKENDRKDGARMPARVGRRDEDAEKDTDGEEGAKRSRAGAGAPSVPVPVAMERAHAEMSSAATVGLLLGHGASVTASTNGNPSEARPSKKAKTTPQAPAGK